MKRTVWIAALALAVTASVSCKDSNRNYISFDASPTQTTDAKSDLPPVADGAASDVAVDRGSPSDSSLSDVASDHGGPGSDAQASDALADSALAQDTASDGTSSDATGADTGSDAADDGGGGQ